MVTESDVGKPEIPETFIAMKREQYSTPIKKAAAAGHQNWDPV